MSVLPRDPRPTSVPQRTASRGERSAWLYRHARALALAAGFILLLLVVALGAIGWIGSERAIHPERKVEPYTLAEFAWSSRTENLRLTSSDGTRIAAWFVPAERTPAPAVALLHGYGRSRSELLPHADCLHRAGYNVLLIDFRGRGESSGGEVTLGLREPQDVRAAVDYLVTRPEVDAGRIALQGVSLGASSGIIEMADDPRVAAIVAESPFTTIRAAVARSFEAFIDLPSFPFEPITIWIVEQRVDGDADDVRPIDAITRIGNRPIFVIEDLGDTKMPVNAGSQIYAAAAPGPRELWRVPDADHADAYDVAPAEYERRVLAFYAAHLGAPAPLMASPTGQVPTLAAEELALRLAPYLLGQADLPQGYARVRLEAGTPATLAPARTMPGADPRAVFVEMQRRGLLMKVGQDIGARSGSPGQTYFVTTWLLAAPDTAAALTMAVPRPGLAGEPVEVATIGDRSAAWHVPLPQPDGSIRDTYFLRWQRGPLVYEVSNQVPRGTTSVDDAVTLAARLDARVASLPPINLTDPTVASPATEEERFEAALSLSTLHPDLAGIPPGYRLMTQALEHPAREVLIAALTQSPAQAADTLRRTVQLQPRVLTLNAAFVPLQRIDAPLFMIVSLHATAEAARAALVVETGDARTTITPVPAPIALGDATVAARQFGAGFYPDGSDLVVYRIAWTQGRVLLTAAMEGQVNDEITVEFARRVEAAYQGSALAR